MAADSVSTPATTLLCIVPSQRGSLGSAELAPRKGELATLIHEMPIRAVVFDLFDTLVDLLSENMPRSEVAGRMIPDAFLRLHALTAEHGPVELDDFLSAMRKLEKQFLESHYSKQIELPTEERFAALARGLDLHDPELIDALVTTHMGAVYEHVRVVEHHREVLESLRDTARLGLCSNFSHVPTAERVLDEAQLSDLFDAIVISETVGIRKPRQEIFQATLDALGVDPHETLHVGDSLKADVEGAAALGIRTVWITRRIPNPETALREFAGPDPDFQIGDLAELPEILREIGRRP